MRRRGSGTPPEYCRIAGIPEADVEAVRQRYSGGELMKAQAAAGAVSDALLDAFTLSGAPGYRDRDHRFPRPEHGLLTLDLI